MESQSISTPWGQSDFTESIGPGILHVMTPSHGGIRVHNCLLADMRPELRKLAIRTELHGWFEEDCAWAAVVVTWPQHFQSDIKTMAQDMLVRCFKIDPLILA